MYNSPHNNKALIDEIINKIANRIDRERLCKFISIAIEANQNHIEILGHTMSPSERFEQEKILNQGAYLSMLLAYLELRKGDHF